MVGAGLWEVQTYSMLGSRDFEKCALPLDKAVKIDNPMNIEESIMRTRILPGLLNVLVHNLNRQQENVFIFEMGKVFATTGAKLPEEKWHLCVVATGTPFLSAADKGGVDYFYLKGILENLFHALSIQDAQFMEANDPLLCPGRSAAIEGCGILGELHPAICAKYEINQPVFFFEIDLDAVFPRRVTEKRYRTLPKFPSVARDVAMFVPEKLEHQMITGLIKKTGGEMVEEVYLFDKYKDSLAYRVIYRHPERTLTDLEVNERHAEIVKTLEAKLQVRIRR
jgi:phenylalanyl-tRNA synthetase beta chain